LARFFIHRPVFAIVISLVIVLAGIVSIPALPIAQYPQITPPVIQVNAAYQGASAEVVEQTVAAPIEQQVNGAEGMLYMRSLCTNSGNYTLQVTFDLSRDQDLAMVDVQNRVNQANALLPADVTKAGLTVKKQSTQNLVYISLYSKDGSKDSLFLSNYATINLIDQLGRLNGVGLATIVAGQRDYSMRLWVRPDLLAKLNVTAEDIAGAIQSQNVQAAAGSIGAPPQEPGQQMQYPVKVKGRLDQPAEFENIILRTQPDGSFLRVKDVARTELGAQTYSSQGTLNGQPAVIIAVYQQPDANAVLLARQVREKMEELSRDFPEGVDYEVTYDSTIFVTKSIEEVVHTLFEAIFLVLVVVFIFLGNFRATLIPILAVPVSLLGTFAGFAGMGFSINLLTMFGLVLAVGIVVDDAIVVVEAVEHHIEHGMTPLQATEKAMDEVSGPVVAIALVLCSVFVPVAFMGGITGEMYRQFAITLSVSVLISALVALTMTPALCVMILRPRKPMRGPLGWFLKAFNWGFEWTTRGYVFLVRRAIRWFVITLALLGAVYFGAYSLMSKLPTGFIPPEDMGTLMVNMTLPSGASLERTTELVQEVEKIVGQAPGVEKTLGLIGYNLVQGTLSSNCAGLVATLKDWDERTDPSMTARGLITSLQAQLAQFPEAQIQVFGPPAIPGLGTTGGVTLELQDRTGGSVEDLAQVTTDFAASAMQSGLFRMAYSLFNPNIPMLDVQVDRDKLAVLGIPVNQAFTAMQINLGGYFVNQFNKFGRTWRVYVQAESQHRRNPEDIGKIHLRSPSSGQMVPLSTVSRIREVTGPDVLVRYNLYRATEVNAEPALGRSSGEAIAALESLAADLPQGYGYEWTGTAYQEKLSSGQTVQILVMGLIFVFLFLAAQYESWGVPFSVLLGLPSVVLGAALGMVLIKMDVNIYVQIGILMLIGLSSKNAILIVEFAKANYEKGDMSLVEAAVDGARLRFRPILMTSFAFIMGVVPLATAVGASATCRRALGMSVLSGMTTATLLGVILIPCLYVYVQFLINLMGGDPHKKAKATQTPAESVPDAATALAGAAGPMLESVAPAAEAGKSEPAQELEAAPEKPAVPVEAGKPAPVEEAPSKPEAPPAPAEPAGTPPSGSSSSKPKTKGS
jgi:hydrophobe/amphiphile efflux-1 (HAE1) family protein